MLPNALNNLARYRNRPQTQPQKPVTPTTPFNSQASYMESAANRDLGGSLASITNQETLTKSQYGFEPDYANTDPFSVSQELNRRYGADKAHTQGSFAARGQLFSSARENAQSSNDLENARRTDTAQKGYVQQLADLAERKAAASTQAADQIAVAHLLASTQATAAPLDPTTVQVPKPRRRRKKSQVIL